MLTINRRIFLFELFTVIMFFCQYRIARKQGYILFFLEVSIGCICWLWNIEKNTSFSKIQLLYFFVIVYKMVFTFMISSGSIENVKNILYKEFGMLFLCYFLLEKCSSVIIIKRIRDFGFFTSLLGCYEFITHSNIFVRFITVESRLYLQTIGTNKTRVQTVFMHPTICGLFMMLSWLCVLFFPYKKLWINYLAKCSILLCLLGTQSRSAWVAFATINLFYIWKKRKEKNICINRRIVFQICILVIVGLAIAIIFREAINNMASIVIKRWLDGMDSNNAANYNRVTMIRMGIQEWMNLGIGNKILGSGNGYAYKFLLNHPIRGWNGAVDNQYLTILLDFGLIGIVLIFILIYLIFRKTFACNNKASQLCGLCLLSMFISGFFYEMFSWVFVTLLFCLFLCILEKNIADAEIV